MAARVERRLAAILGADVVGYSRLMERDEAGTLARLKAHRKEFLTPLIAEHRGRIVKLMGDGVLCEFGSIVDAVACAVLIQRGMAEREANVPEGERIRFRIGINLGDVIHEEDGDLYGDGVNIAARLEQLCEPGGVAISGTAYDHLPGKLDFPITFVGEQRVKNIERPVRVYRVSPGGTPAVPGAGALPLPDRPSIAVLPFDNLSGDPGQAYFADGIVEDITTALARIRWLFVIARNSSFTYKGKAVDVRQVGRELGVRYVLEGSVRRAGDRLRITGQLIEAATGAHLWAERFDGTLEDVFELQDRIAEAVAGVIEPTLRRAEIERARRKPTDNLDAYDLYLRALPHAYAITPEDNSEALRLLDRALALDPGYAAAAGLKAWGHEQRCLRGWADDAAVDRMAAERLARLAIAAGADDPTALAMGGFVLAVLARDHEAALAALRRSVELNPSSALALGFAALVHCFAGDYGTAIEQGLRALRLSPFDPLIYHPLIALAYAHLFTDRPAEAAGHAARAIQANPGFEVPHTVLVASLVQAGRTEEAREAARRLLAASPACRVGPLRRIGFRDAPRFEAYLHDLRQAGLPD